MCIMHDTLWLYDNHYTAKTSNSREAITFPFEGKSLVSKAWKSTGHFRSNVFKDAIVIILSSQGYWDSSHLNCAVFSLQVSFHNYAHDAVCFWRVYLQ